VDLAMGARAFAMGGAFAAIADDATAAYWNPAGLSQLQYITFSETNWLLAEVDNVNVNYFNAVFPLSGIGTIAGGWLLQHAQLEEGHGETYRETGYNEHAFSLTAGRRLWEKLWIFEKTSVGFSLNRHLISAGGDNGAGVGFDVGVLTCFPFGFRLGLVARSIATDMMGDKIEPEYRLGLGYVFSHPRHRVTVAVDLLTKADVEYEADVKGVEDTWGTNHKGFGGLEYCFLHEELSVALRLGGNMLANSDRENIVLAGGLGVGFSGVEASYAYQMNTENDLSIGMTHRVTLELQLEPIAGMIKKDREKKSRAQPVPRQPQTAGEPTGAIGQEAGEHNSRVAPGPNWLEKARKQSKQPPDEMEDSQIP
jgi:hypothetical protein